MKTTEGLPLAVAAYRVARKVVQDPLNWWDLSVCAVPHRVRDHASHPPHPQVVEDDDAAHLEHQVDIEEVDGREVEQVVAIDEGEFDSVPSRSGAGRAS